MNYTSLGLRLITDEVGSSQIKTVQVKDKCKFSSPTNVPISPKSQYQISKTEQVPCNKRREVDTTCIMLQLETKKNYIQYYYFVLMHGI